MSEPISPEPISPAFPLPDRRWLSLPGLELAYRVWGEGNEGGEPVLLLHGLGDCAAVWAATGAVLGGSPGGDRYRVVAPDLRGHGDSGKPDGGYDWASVVGDLEALLDRLGWDRAHIVGHSWTGKVVALWMRQNPGRFRSAVLVDPFFIGRIPSWTRVTFPLLYGTLPFLKLMGPFESRDRAVAVARSLKQFRDWTPLQQQAAAVNLEQKPDGSWGSKLAVAARNEIFEDTMQTAGLTEPIAVPTLLLLPEKGLNRTDFQIAPFRRYLQNLTIRAVPGNHWAFLTDPDPFSAAIATFFAETPG